MPPILIADDDPDIAALLMLMLRREGHEVVIATNGVEALELARRERPRIALLDIHMPGLNGYELARRIRGDPALRSMRIVIVSAKALQNTTAEDSLRAGADAHLYKPFTTAELRSAVGGEVA